MWWPRGQASPVGSRRQRAGRALATAVCLLPLLAGCEGTSGFRPMYGSPAVGGAGGKLEHVSFGTIPGRVGQRIRNELIFQSTGGGHPLDPLYRFDVNIREQVISTLVAKDGEARSQVFNLEARFQLIRQSDKKVVLEGTSYARAAFERYTSIFSNVRAREDAENRAAQTVAQDMRSRLAAYLAGAV